MEVCSVINCSSIVSSKGLCKKHYKRQWRHGDPTIINRRQESKVFIFESCAEIDLTQGYRAVIDLIDVSRVQGYIWRYSNGYARSHELNIYLHQHIVGPVLIGMEIDHEDRDKLNCRRSNLKPKSHRDNCINTDAYDNSKGTEMYVCRDGNVTWYAYVMKFGKKIHLGVFESETEALLAHKVAKQNTKSTTEIVL